MTGHLYLRSASWERTDRRTVEALLAPWDTPAQVFDVVDGRLDMYREGFRRGAADRQVNSPEPGTIKRITLKDQHEGGIGKLGHLIALRNSDAGLHGVAQVLPSRIEDFDAMMELGIDGLSVEFHPIGRPLLDPAGTRWRTRIHLEAVALEAEPAYAASRILAVRAAADIEAEEAQEQAERKSKLDELDAWLAEARASQARLTAT